MIIKTKIFELCNSNYGNLCELAEAMGISVSQIYRVREGKRHINQKFIIGAIRAFPGCKLDDLFYLAPELSTVTTNHRRRASAIQSTGDQAGRVKRGSRQQEVKALPVG